MNRIKVKLNLKFLAFTMLFVITIILPANAGTKTWTGSVSTDWGVAGNWSPSGVPNSGDDPIIPTSPSGGRFPEINASYSAHNLTIEVGATLTQSGGTFSLNDLYVEYGVTSGRYDQISGTLQIDHDWVNSGVFNSTGGTIQFTGTAGGGATFATGQNQFFNIIVNTGVDPHFDADASSLVLIGGNFTNYNTGLDNSTNVTFRFTGSVDQNIYSPTSAGKTPFGNFEIWKTGGTAYLNSNIEIAGNATLTNGAFDIGSYTFKRETLGGSLTLSNSANLKIGGTNGMPTSFTTRSFSSTSTVEFSGTNQAVNLENYGNLTLSGSGTKTFANGTTGIAGALNINGSATPQTLGGTCTIDYNGSGDQTVKAMSYNNLTLSNAGIKTFQSGFTMIYTNFTISGSATADATTNNSLISYNGISAQTITPINYYDLVLNSQGTKIFAPGTSGIAGSLTVSGSAVANAITNNTTIEYNGSGTQTIMSMDYHNLVLSGSGIKIFSAGTTGIAGNFSVIGNVTVNTVTNSSNIDFKGTANQTVSAIDYYDLTLSNSGTKYFGAGTVGIGGNLELKDLAEVDAITYNDTVKYYLINKTVRYGFINKNVLVSSQTSVTSMTDISVTGSLIISPDAVLDMNAYVLTVGEKLINNGTYISTNPAGSMSFYSKSSGDFNSLDSWSNSSYSGAAAVRLPGTVNNDVLIIGDNKTINLTSSISNLGTVRVDSSGTLNPDSYVVSGPGEFDLRKGGTLKIISPNGIDSASGNIQTATRLYDASANYEFSGTSPQITGTEFRSSASNLTINNLSGVTLSNSTRLSSDLSLTQGSLILGVNNLTLGSASSIIGTPSSTNMIVASGTGQLRKEFTSACSFTFPVGDDSSSVEYSPITLNFTSGNFSSAYVGVNVVNTKHPQDSSATHFINRYWTVNSNGITDFSCDVTCNYTDEDIQPGADETKIYSRQFNGSEWTLLNPVNASLNELSGTVSSFSDFTGGESNATTDIKIASDNTPISFAVYQNYPNPFNPSTKIRYAIPNFGAEESNGFVTLKVYDILGNEVATLVNEGQTSGFYEVDFDGSQLSSGVYIYKLQVNSANGRAGNFSETRKMLLTK